jgi:hypothetical protein
MFGVQWGGAKKLISGHIFGSHCSEIPNISKSKWRKPFAAGDANQL